MNKNEYAFEILNIKKIYKNQKGLKEITASFRRGEITAILGHNGAGKTTLIKLITKEVKPDAGQILVNNKIPEKEFYDKIGFLPDQNSFPLDYKLKEFIIYNGVLRGIPREKVVKKAQTFIDKMGLSKFSKKTFRQLSSGMKKMALLATAMINDPEVIIMDEPTANMDIEKRAWLLELLVELSKAGKTVIITSHILDELEKIIDNLIIIQNGIKKYDQPFDKNQEKLADIYNGINQTDIGNESHFKDIFK
ncbi:ABC transporter ATP-binding protein [Spiroplasma alleghenense]|uniref:ABC transporter ATP-binding protein n=1 Tax=Spiroplasma alleghenense TaxID=216931 RepID=A0A345Z583_9MOLU|nr:ABC transporter ATP-binding protein [Spiroplasma alleghenense]AXK51762.1 ABC transporter ATP-binding protein [Spiroplasma alleghenense]